MKRIGIGFSIVMAGCQGATASDESAQVMPVAELQEAHTAYVEEDYQKMMGTLKGVLMRQDLDDSAKENVFALYKAARTASCGEGLPMDWQEPQGTRWLTMSQIRSNEPDGSYFQIKFSGHMEEIDTISQIRIRKHGEEPVVDLAAGLGDLYTEKDEAEGTYYFDVDSGFKRTPNEDGLYLITIETKGGESVEGWFILNDLLGSQTANVSVPAVGEVMRTSTPTFVWEHFVSPEYKPCERRKMVLNVVPLPQQDEGWTPAFSLYKYNPALTTFTVGTEDPDVTGTDRLANGTYWFTLDYREEYTVGPLKMRRQMRTGRDFSIAAP